MPSSILWDHEHQVTLEWLQEKGCVEPLVALLRDCDRPLHPELRLWLALMLTGDHQCRWRLECKRHPRWQKRDLAALTARDLKIGLFIHRLWSEGKRLIDAKGEATEKFDLQDRRLDDVWTMYREVSLRLRDSGIPLAPELKPLRPRRRR